MEQLTEQSTLDIYDEIISMRKEMLKEIFKEKYNIYRIDDNIWLFGKFFQISDYFPKKIHLILMRIK